MAIRQDYCFVDVYFAVFLEVFVVSDAFVMSAEYTFCLGKSIVHLFLKPVVRGSRQMNCCTDFISVSSVGCCTYLLVQIGELEALMHLL